MNLLVFSHNGVFYEDGGKGDMTAIFLPMVSQERRFNDMDAPNHALVKSRYGETSGTPLWRVLGNEVIVYGSLSKHYIERRGGVEVYLPQDYVPEGISIFYMVFGDNLVVHGQRVVSEDGKESWGISYLKHRDNVVSEVQDAISERALEGVKEKILVSVYNNNTAFDELSRVLEPFDADVVRFESLTLPKKLKPLYHHRNYGLLMLTLALFALLLLAASVVFLVLGTFKLEQEQAEILSLQEQIRRVQTNKKLGHIKDPKQLLDQIQSAMPQPPSGLIHAAAEVGRLFGTLKKVELLDEADFGRAGRGSTALTKRWKDVIILKVEVEGDKEELYLDQERVAKAALVTRPWVRFIERSSKENQLELLIGVKTK